MNDDPTVGRFANRSDESPIPKGRTGIPRKITDEKIALLGCELRQRKRSEEMYADRKVAKFPGTEASA